MAYDVFCQSIQGAGHIKKGMPCEDYGIKFENDECKIFALGDGHGDPNCPRSSFGSRTVCEIAVQDLQLFAKEIRNQKWEERLMDEHEAKELVHQLVTSIFGKWSCAVNEDFSQNPLSEKEEEEAKDYIESYKRGEEIEHIYGTTFIAALLTDKYLLLLQQGDGRCVVFDADGNATQPIPWDDGCVGNVTTSLCNADAVQRCRHHVIDVEKNPVMACVAGSDGVEDSFPSMERLHAYYREKLLIASTADVEEFEKHLLETLPLVSEKGSRDDITICGFIDRALVKKKENKLLTDSKTAIINETIRNTQERIDSMALKLNFLQNKRAEAENQCSGLRNRYSGLEQEYASIKKDLDVFAQTKSNTPSAIKVRIFSAASARCLQKRLDRIREEKEEVSKEIKASLDKKKAYDEEYAACKQRYDGYVDIVKENEAKIKTLKSSSDSQPVEPVRESTENKAEVSGAVVSAKADSTASIVDTTDEEAANPVQSQDISSEGAPPASDAAGDDLKSKAPDKDANATAVAEDEAEAIDDFFDKALMQRKNKAKAAGEADVKKDEAETVKPGAAEQAAVNQSVPDEKEKKSKSGLLSRFKKNKT